MKNSIKVLSSDGGYIQTQTTYNANIAAGMFTPGGEFFRFVASSAYTSTNGTGSLIVTDGATVGSLSDKASNNRHLNSSAGAPVYKTNRINGKPTVLFNGSSDRLSTGAITMTLPMTYIMVIKSYGDNVASRYVFDGVNTNSTGLTYSSATAANIAGGSSSVTFSTNFDLLFCSFSSAGGTAVTQLNDNASMSASASISNPGGFQFADTAGYSRYAHVELAEMLCYSSVLSYDSGLGKQARRYLASQYGLSLTTVV